VRTNSPDFTVNKLKNPSVSGKLNSLHSYAKILNGNHPTSSETSSSASVVVEQSIENNDYSILLVDVSALDLKTLKSHINNRFEEFNQTLLVQNQLKQKKSGTFNKKQNKQQQQNNKEEEASLIATETTSLLSNNNSTTNTKKTPFPLDTAASSMIAMSVDTTAVKQVNINNNNNSNINYASVDSSDSNHPQKTMKDQFNIDDVESITLELYKEPQPMLEDELLPVIAKNKSKITTSSSNNGESKTKNKKHRANIGHSNNSSNEEYNKEKQKKLQEDLIKFVEEGEVLKLIHFKESLFFNPAAALHDVQNSNVTYSLIYRIAGFLVFYCLFISF
jgi:hypothetical protein